MKTVKNVATQSGGIACFNDTSWIVFNEDSSGLPTNAFASVHVDKFGNIWMGSYNEGLIVHREGGVLFEFETNQDDKVVFNPDEFFLEQNYPNPFNPSTTIEFSLPQTSAVTLKVYNLVGEEIKTLIDGERNAGRHKIIFDASGLSSGVYLFKITTGYYNETKKLILMK